MVRECVLYLQEKHSNTHQHSNTGTKKKKKKNKKKRKKVKKERRVKKGRKKDKEDDEEDKKKKNEKKRDDQDGGDQTPVQKEKTKEKKKKKRFVLRQGEDGNVFYSEESMEILAVRDVVFENLSRPFHFLVSSLVLFTFS
tara:strand:+ start:316 stop:735 length:420 start_codon:yes stop_codon:yes gene_type:complete